MNIVSNHNRLLRGAAIPTAGGDVYNSGWEYTPEGEISGYSGSAIYTGVCECDSAAVVDSAFNKSTAWVDEQNYLTAHQDVTNLPYVQNSALEFSPQGLISGISGSGFYATSAEGAFTADTAYFAYNAEHADSADYVESAHSAQYAHSANSALNAEIANVSYTALTANFLDGGWEHDDDGFITAYNNSAFAGAGGGGRYEGISPIVVNNEEMRISAKSALLGVQNPLYFVEDSETATVIGVYESAFSGRDWTDDITAASANALNEAINQITAVELANSALTAQTAINANHANSSDSATYDSLGRKIVDTYLTAHQTLPDWGPTISAASGNAYNSAVNWVVDQHYLTAVTGDNTPYTQGPNIDITNHVVSGKDWTNDIQNASSYAYDQATAQIPAVTGLPYVENSALDYTPGGHLVSSISSDGLYAVSAEGAFNAETANYSYVAETANYVADGWEYNENDEITGYSGSAIHSEAGGEGKVYTGVAPIVVDNTPTTGVISAQTAQLGVQSPLYFVTDTSAQTVIGISGLPDVEGLMYESALGLTAGSITSYNGSAFSAQGGGNPQVPVSGVSGISITKPGDTVLIGFTGNLTGNYLPYTATGTNNYLTNSALTFTSDSGYIEIHPKNTSYQNEAHLRLVQNYTGNYTYAAEIDGADGGQIHQKWSNGENQYPAYMMSWSINGLIYDRVTAQNETVRLAGWLTADWNNAKALYTHVNSASANWTNVQIVASTAQATGSNIIYFVTGA